MDRRSLAAGLLAAPFAIPACASDQSVPAPTPTPAQRASALFAVEFRTGPKWDPVKKPHEQAWFAEHSANLKRLRDSGSLLVGARYADKGFIVLAAESEAVARAGIEADPSIQNQVFAFEIHPFRVFYPGCVGQPGPA